ncbi:fungal-specific transcription factor domain-containing protein [Talaromyces proteolyticus]|uniref:Fungal-specific transcription factor domain-containing protein n=1 Tax=Talaromyces proteolyticus TaxID=1131652 RepID=A0AAD4Q1H1_9EURO|nr:fungal-specific transcription factor domain-containing protein [Talaromyces proteolyticus]KAH8702274.1 fungal-specific transcription factor domain-containing protein [Talaromyces proteolyticus]
MPNGSTTETRASAKRPPKRIGVSKTTLFCRTCERCRTKKVKCSGDRPHCNSCVASNQECRYPEDARRSNRTTKADTKALRNEISILRQFIFERQQLDSSVEARLATRTLHDVQPPVAKSSSNHANVNVGTSFPTSDTAPTSTNVLEPASGELPMCGPSPEALLSDPQCRSRINTNQPRRGSNGTPRSSEQGRQSTSPQNIYITGTVTNDGQVQAYGVTSTLHEPPALLPETNTPAEDEEDKIIRHQLIRDQLISNAVIQRQRETAIFLGPQMQATIELDGVAPDVALHLFNLHWNRQHYSYLLTYRPAIMDSLMNGGPHVNKLLLNAIYYSSSLSCDSGDGYSATDNPLSTRFYRRFKELLVDEIDRPSVPTAVALLLCGASLVSHGKQSAGWVLCGTAYRMIIDLGCHLSMEEAQQHKPPLKMTTIEFEIRKRVYWGAFMNDKFQSLYLGRAPALRSSEAQLPKELLDSYEELEMWEPYTGILGLGLPGRGGQQSYQPQPAYAVSTFTSLLNLAEIASRIIDAFYSKECLSAPTEAMTQAKIDLEGRLDDWQRHLPAHLNFDSDSDRCPVPPPHQITLHTTFWTLNILLERPFLSTGHLNYVFHATSQAVGEEKCATSVFRIWSLVRAYRSTFTLRRAPYLLCYAIYSAVLLILRQTPQSRERFSGCVSFFWSALLDLQQGCNAGLKKPLNILKTLVRRLGEENPQILAILGERRAKHFPNSGESGTPLNANPSAARLAESGITGCDPQQQTFLDDAEMLGSLYGDMGSLEQWLSTDIDDGGLLDDSMYGLFTS